MKLILYLEPPKHLFDKINDYYAETALKFGSTEAHQYIPHCSLVGFFEADPLKIIDFLNPLCSNLSEKTLFLNIEISKSEKENLQSLKIKLKAPNEVINIVKKLANEFQLRIKPMDHISLAYNFKSLKPLNLFEYYEYASSTIVLKNDYCDVVLYEQIESVTGKHTFIEKKRYSTKNHQATAPSL